MKKNILMDMDGTICEDIPNEESHRFAEAQPFKKAAYYLNKLAEAGHVITYFTSREEKDRAVTLAWLKKHDFPVHGLIMNKPRGGNYFWVDNLGPQGITFQGTEWTEVMFALLC